MANIIFRIPQKFYILKDFTQDSLNEISDKMWKINKETGSNECNFYDLEEFITFENIKINVKNLISEIHYGIEYVAIEIDSDVHKISKKRVMSRVPLETFKGLNLHTIFISKRYEITSNKNGVLKLEGLEKEISLNKVKYEYLIKE
jgi:hypothetical protein